MIDKGIETYQMQYAVSESPPNCRQHESKGGSLWNLSNRKQSNVQNNTCTQWHVPGIFKNWYIVNDLFKCNGRGQAEEI